ncbi:hypothetical protein ACFTZK_03940 [Streptomyces decoyicus]|uniref:hypothetical protein n=1 Tax=Streptomyces decoyicus TaxID=249567 RepID=UPI003645086F
MAHTDRTGIGTSSTWGRRPGHPEGPGAAFAPITGLLVHHHTVRDVGGNGPGGVTFRNHLFVGASQGHGVQRVTRPAGSPGPLGLSGWVGQVISMDGTAEPGGAASATREFSAILSDTPRIPAGHTDCRGYRRAERTGSLVVC